MTSTCRWFYVDVFLSMLWLKSSYEFTCFDVSFKQNVFYLFNRNVIHALTSKSSLYIPFRNSTLTRILKESLGGNSKASLMVRKVCYGGGGEKCEILEQ